MQIVELIPTKILFFLGGGRDGFFLGGGDVIFQFFCGENFCCDGGGKKNTSDEGFYQPKFLN